MPKNICPLTKKCLLAFIIPSLMYQAFAEPAVDLGKLKVTKAQASTQGKLGEVIKNRKTLDSENIQSTYDLVRYSTEVDVAQVGRYGNKGFAIRGVDGNRVAMNIDGVPLPTVESNEIFSPYGYQYEGRFNPDIEMMGGVRVLAGSDSLVSGSGAVGGSVSYNTKEPSQLVKGGNLGGYAKLGYTNKNDEKLTAAGLAGVYDKAEFLVNYAHRTGHELKNHDMKRHDRAKLQPTYAFSRDEMPNGTTSLVYPDALKYSKDTALVKFYYNINDSHRVGLHGLYQLQKNHMNTQSKHTYGSANGSTTRFAHDKEKLQNYGVNYRYTPTDSRVLDTLDLDYTNSKVLGLADTWEYDLGYDRVNINNPKLSYREYRPIYTTTDQLSLKLDGKPADFGKFGEHNLSLKSIYAKQDYTSTAHYLGYQDNQFSAERSFVNFAFTDAKKNLYSIILSDSIYFNDRLKASAGVRYDNMHYKPYLQNDEVGTSPTSKTESAKAYGTCVSNNAQSVFCDAYRIGLHNKDSKFKHLTWNAMLDYALIKDKLTARYKVGTGFLAPTITQVYSNFVFQGNEQIPNYNLKPETSLTHEVELEFKPKQDLSVTVGGYTTKYRDFIHTKYWQSDRNTKLFGCTNFTCLQSFNLDNAQIKGIKLGVKADLTNLTKLNGNLDLTADYHFSKDKALVQTDYNGTKQVNTLAAVPAMLMAGLNYQSPNNDWSLHGKLSYTQAKKSSDAKYLKTETKYKQDTLWCKDPIYAGYCDYGNFNQYDNVRDDFYKIDKVADGYSEEVQTYDIANRSKSVLMLDVYGTKKFGKNKNLILNAGVYNITNQKHIPWQTLRQFATTNINAMVDKQGNGFNRYTAPGRNYAISLTYEF